MMNPRAGETLYSQYIDHGSAEDKVAIEGRLKASVLLILKTDKAVAVSDWEISTVGTPFIGIMRTVVSVRGERIDRLPF